MTSRWIWITLCGVGTIAGIMAARRRAAAGTRRAGRADDQVGTASDESFPASDPPSFTPTQGSVVAG